MAARSRLVAGGVGGLQGKSSPGGSSYASREKASVFIQAVPAPNTSLETRPLSSLHGLVSVVSAAAQLYCYTEKRRVQVIKYYSIDLFLAITMIFFVAGSRMAFADSDLSEENTHKEKQWYVGPRIGLSRFTGIIGLEIQKGYFAFTVGLPTRGGLKYYFTPVGSAPFLGIFAQRYSYNDDNDVHRENREIGGGVGYRWRWRDAWDLVLGLNIGFRKEEREKSFARTTEEKIFISPAISAGYSF